MNVFRNQLMSAYAAYGMSYDESKVQCPLVKLLYDTKTVCEKCKLYNKGPIDISNVRRVYLSLDMHQGSDECLINLVRFIDKHQLNVILCEVNVLYSRISSSELPEIKRIISDMVSIETLRKLFEPPMCNPIICSIFLPTWVF